MAGPATRHLFGLAAVAAGGVASAQLFATLGSPASEGRALRARPTCEVERKQAITGSGGLSRNSIGMSSMGALGLSMAMLTIARRAAGRKNRRAASTVSLKAFENELGVQAPVGYWDPLGYAADGDAELFRRRREIEIKHGRVSMLACMGYIVPEYFRWPGFCSPSDKLAFADIPNGLAALKVMPVAGVLQLFAFAGHVEVKFLTQDPSRDPGDFENCGIFGVPNRGEGVIVGKLKEASRIKDEAAGKLKEPSRIKDEAARKTKLNAELANGRLAMMAIIGMFFQDGLTGAAWGDWALYEGSPLR